MRGRARRPGPLVGLVALAAFATTGCTSTLQRAAVWLWYEEAALPAERVRLDLPYVEGPGAHPTKHRLDLFLPEAAAEPWPVVLYVHGGGWTTGDRTQVAGGADVHRNVGRWLASRGVGAAVTSYRLQPEVGWAEQVRDVARALAWLRANVARFGGDPDALFLAGHSAGAWLAGRAGLDRDALRAAGVPASSVCGLALVSGAAYDLEDARTHDLGADPGFFAARFDDGAPGWRRRASLVPLVRADAPPVLVLYASGEPARLRRQSELLVEALRAVGATVERVVVPGEDHQRIVLTLSRGDRTSGPALLRLVGERRCGTH